MVHRSDNKTRRDFQEQRQREAYDGTGIDDYLSPEELDDLVAAHADRNVREEDERIWAHYRDPKSDVTQLEARERAQYVDYPKQYQVSQSTVSRRLSSLDYSMLSEPIDNGMLGEAMLLSDEVDALDHHDTAHALEVYRRILARFIVDVEAMRRCMVVDFAAPQWAASRFEEVSATLGARVQERLEHGGERPATTADD
jgi:hypothetical protein